MPQSETKYFGTVSYDDQTVITFPAGLPAFERYRRFLPIEDAARRPFIFLQSLDDPLLCFLTLPVAALDPGYQLKMSAEDLAAIGLERPPAATAGLLCLAVVSFHRDGIPAANLLAPVVVNAATRQAVQSVRDDSVYSSCHPLAPAPEATPCS
ncbi:MAG: flagellar assembly protein FliW [Acidobacteriia bacterium]|nr:flagellar assembly protein FliW [Terriglobia bacterium]